MEKRVTSGQGIIALKTNDFSSILVIQNPFIVNWPDCEGSIGAYYVMTDYPENDRNFYTHHLNEVLSDGTDQEVLEAVSDFLAVFENGLYTIGIQTIPMDTIAFHTSTSTAVFPHDSFNGSFYGFKDLNLFFTLPNSQFSTERVAYYQELIRKGKQPKPLILVSDYGNFAPDYVLDGHHKLEAYRRLRKDIPVVIICKHIEAPTPADEMLHLARTLLNDTEFEHYFVNSTDLETIDFVRDELLTQALDQILEHTNHVEVSLIQLLLKHVHSEQETERIWGQKRLLVLTGNKCIHEENKNLYVFIPKESAGNNSWYSRCLKSPEELQEWMRSMFN